MCVGKGGYVHIVKFIGGWGLCPLCKNSRRMSILQRNAGLLEKFCRGGGGYCPVIAHGGESRCKNKLFLLESV